jgi:2',3'-cyclic-nucleotide 2'-phosphodiesterase (5'-nucleotidase family)
MRDFYAVLPFNNYLVAVRMSGRQLRETLEHGVSAVELDEGRFPQVSGLRFTFDAARPVGQRVGAITVAGEPLQVEREYTVATLDFIASGGDGYKAFGSAIREGGDFSATGGAIHSSRLVYNDPGRWLRDIVAAELKKRGEFSPAADGRIKRAP